MLCHGKPLSCAKKSKTAAAASSVEDNDSEGEDMYGFMPTKPSVTPAASVRRENIYETSPRKPAAKAKVVTFLDEPPQVRRIQRRHSCAENYRSYTSAANDQQLLPTPIQHSPMTSPYSTLSQRERRLQPPPQQQQQRQQPGEREQPPFPHWRSSDCAANSVCGHYWRRIPPPSLATRPPPPSYHVAVRRAASFSASRGVGANRFAVRRPPCSASDGPSVAPQQLQQQEHQQQPQLEPRPAEAGKGHGDVVVASTFSNQSRAVSSSTSDLYVDSFALKRARSRDLLSITSSTSSMSEATVYRKIGPCDYVSVNDKRCSKSFGSRQSSCNDRVQPNYGTSVRSSTKNIENGGDRLKKEINGLNLPCTDSYQVSMANSKAMRNESPDNDSAFSDSVSLISSESSTSSSTAPTTNNYQCGCQLLENYQLSSTMDKCNLSDSGSSGCDVASELEFPCGTIKQKLPKLPLTATTRQLASLDARATNATMLEQTPSFGSLPPTPPELLTGTLTLSDNPAVDLPPPPLPQPMLPLTNQTFILDLQHVMHQKWQKAQKCKRDLSVAPYEKLGFYDPLDYKDTNVRNWVAEYNSHSQDLYKNVHIYGESSIQQQPVPEAIVPAFPPLSSSNGIVSAKMHSISFLGTSALLPPSSALSLTSSSNTGMPIKKRSPPPPPPRAVTTRLTTSIA